MILSKPVPLAPPYRFTTVPSGPLEQAASEAPKAAVASRESHREDRENVRCRAVLINPPVASDRLPGSGSAHELPTRDRPATAGKSCLQWHCDTGRGEEARAFDGWGSPSARCQRTTVTEHFAYAATWWLTEPSTSPAKPPCPRLPTTSRSASADSSISTFAGLPCRTCGRTSTGGSSPSSSLMTWSNSPAVA